MKNRGALRRKGGRTCRLWPKTRQNPSFRVCEVKIRPNRRAAKMGERCGWKGAAGMTGGLAGAARGSGIKGKRRKKDDHERLCFRYCKISSFSYPFERN